MKIPFVCLSLQYDSIRSEIDQAIESVLSNAQFVGGEPVRKFETEFTKVFEVPYCVSTGNGTDSLYLILKALGLQEGDEVITPAFSCIASAETITLAGGKPVFCDVDPLYYVIDTNEVLKKITSKTKAVIAVHLFGQSAPVSALKKICDAHNLFLIEDCAQAHLTQENKKFVGTFGVASAFSFYPTKNLGAYGDAGCILTRDAALAETMRRLANHGALIKDDHRMEGTNSRMDTLQAAVLSVKLKHLKAWNAKRAALAGLYKSLLADVDQLILPAERENTKHTYHIFCIQTSMRDSLKSFLAKNGIDTLIHYPKGLPYTDAYKRGAYSHADFPVTYHLQEHVLSLPLYPELTTDEVNFIAQSIRQYFSASPS